MSNKYSAEFKEQAVKRVLAGESAAKLTVVYCLHGNVAGNDFGFTVVADEQAHGLTLTHDILK